MHVVRDLVEMQCAVLTIGQYLQPTHRHHAVQRFVPPQEFEDLKEMAVAVGMKEVMAGPLVRSSFRAGQIIEKLRSSSARHEDRGFRNPRPGVSWVWMPCWDFQVTLTTDG